MSKDKRLYRTIYIDHIEDGVTEEELGTILGEFGALDAFNMPKDTDGNTMGFAFAEYSSNNGAHNAYNSWVEHDQRFRGWRVLTKKEWERRCKQYDSLKRRRTSHTQRGDARAPTDKRQRRFDNDDSTASMASSTSTSTNVGTDGRDGPAPLPPFVANTIVGVSGFPPNVSKRSIRKALEAQIGVVRFFDGSRVRFDTPAEANKLLEAVATNRFELLTPNGDVVQLSAELVVGNEEQKIWSRLYANLSKRHLREWQRTVSDSNDVAGDESGGGTGGGTKAKRALSRAERRRKAKAKTLANVIKFD